MLVEVANDLTNLANELTGRCPVFRHRADSRGPSTYKGIQREYMAKKTSTPDNLADLDGLVLDPDAPDLTSPDGHRSDEEIAEAIVTMVLAGRTSCDPLMLVGNAGQCLAGDTYSEQDIRRIVAFIRWVQSMPKEKAFYVGCLLKAVAEDLGI